MEDYKVENSEELLNKINEEVEVLESIFDGEGIVIEKPTAGGDQDVKSTNDSGSHDDADDGTFAVQMELNLKPNTGFEEMKVGVLIHAKLIFGHNYPMKQPRIQLTQKKGLDDFLFDEILDKFNDE